MLLSLIRRFPLSTHVHPFQMDCCSILPPANYYYANDAEQKEINFPSKSKGLSTIKRWMEQEIPNKEQKFLIAYDCIWIEQQKLFFWLYTLIMSLNSF